MSSNDDPFAALFGNAGAPDPRPATAPTPAAPTHMGPVTGSTPAAPGSRRAAREARLATGAIPIISDADAQSVADAAPWSGPQTVMAAQAAAPQAAPAHAVQAAQPVQAPQPAHPAQSAQPVQAPQPVQAAQPIQAAASAPSAPQPVQAAAQAAPAQTGEVSFDSLFATPRTPVLPAATADHDDDPAEAWILAGSGQATLSATRDGAAGATGGPGYARTGVPSGATPTVTSFEDLFSDSGSGSGSGGGRRQDDERPRRRIGGWIALGVILLLLGGVAAGGWYVWTNYEDKVREILGWELPKDYSDGEATGEALLTISEGDVPSVISQSLYDAGVTMTPTAFYDMLIEQNLNPEFYPGVYRLQQKMTSEAALAALQDPANKMENSALLREGLTVDQSLPILAEATGIPIEEFQAAVADPSAYGITVDPAIAAAGGQPLEGWLFPALYEFDPGITAQGVIQRLVNRTIESLDNAGVPVERRQEILTLASIIQREARSEVDMQKVSRVMQNRLDPSNQETLGLLQMDSTAQYGAGEVGSGSASTSENAQYDPNPWNTYVHAGLPIGPIANSGDIAIDAAMHPADGPWMYFVTVNMNTGETEFTSTLAEHERARQKMIEWCKANPGTGC